MLPRSIVLKKDYHDLALAVAGTALQERIYQNILLAKFLFDCQTLARNEVLPEFG